ncbi:hypothetical protein ACLOJK_000275 [Asimina triloba]
MALKSSTALDYWRKFFHGAKSDIFEVIEHAIAVAATDSPKEFRVRRDGIAEKLYSCLMVRCSGCDRVELAVPAEEEEDGGCGNDFRAGAADDGQKDGQMNSSLNDSGMVYQVGNYSYDEAEALTEEIEEANQVVGEVLRIKEVLANQQDEVTKIGMAVKGLTKHVSKQIRHLARRMEGYDTTMLVSAGSSSDSVNPSSAVEEEGLPSPPLDEGAFLTTQPTGMELAQFFDGMDDDGSEFNSTNLLPLVFSFADPRNTGEFDKNRGNRRNHLSENHIPKRKQQSPVNEPMPEVVKSQVRKPVVVCKQTKSSSVESGPGRPQKTASEQRVDVDAKLKQRTELAGVQKRQSQTVQDKSKNFDELSVQVKLEAAKRKLQEGYQQAENAKKQRTIQSALVPVFPGVYPLFLLLTGKQGKEATLAPLNIRNVASAPLNQSSLTPATKS